MYTQRIAVPVLLAVAAVASTFSVITLSAAQAPPKTPDQTVAPAPRGGGTLARFDFEGGSAAAAWAALSAVASPPRAVTAKATVAPVGTIDVAGGKEPSRGLLLSVTGSAAPAGAWSAGLVSGPLPVRNAETNLGKLTLAFSLSASAVRPVRVRVESFDAAKKRTGGLEALVYPAAPDFHQRYALDLSAMKPAGGGGAFQPTAPFVQFTFALEAGPGEKAPAAAPGYELRVDNVHYARPAFYVSAKGKDTNDGRTEKAAFATPQKAIDVAQPGDIVLVMEGTYLPRDVQEGVVAFRRPGSPDAWITLKNYPGQRPLLSPVGAWNAIRIGQRGTKEVPSPLPALAYLEVRGLHIRGDADVAKQKYAEFIGKADPRTNGNATTITGRYEKNTPHHIRIADNLMELCAGGATGSGNVDWITVENNVIRNNCWWMIYAGSGISILGTSNFDASDNVYKSLVRNNVVSGNRCFMPWAQIKKISDGNGIIVDSNHVPARNESYRGRTLVQNNLVFNNGGSGIHAFKSHRIDIINNTAYLNGASPELRWGQIFLQRTDDARVVNNILWARDGQPVNTVSANLSDKENTNVVRSHNLYFGGGSPPIMGENDVVADPQFVKPSVDHAAADFRVRPGSPAIDTGARLAILPWLDLDGKRHRATPDRGAYEK